MKFTRRSAIALALAALPTLAITPAMAAEATTVNVSLWDKGDNSMDDLGQLLPMGFNMAGAGERVSKATMGVAATPSIVPAGKVTFEVKNDSKGTVHEMIVAPIKSATEDLPYDKDEMRVEEEKAGHLGEVSELDPGQSGSLTVTLKPGEYILYCNIPGHYVMGMWTLVRVE
ncbi:putative cupredoxin-like copper-binding protein [Thioclava sp. ES.031]|uniref:plastocyanin/azurin family copper-binding protein n=1 Tax=Thioclava sp. ES.031 TaxID=1798203 RepID=UPI000BF6DC50|nr:plastocyanin/azurin family copper-binding protein [Thioclava sp. ES.031]PFG62216.1 putative cupredoxin-like copper-binding protein [Thioclava sp. ES.031]